MFKETIDSILVHWTDTNHIDAWFCVVSEKSSEYDWIDYSLQESNELLRMNLIWNKLNEVKPTYWIHIQEGFVFHTTRSYVLDAIRGLEKMEVDQLIYNRNYGVSMKCDNIKGHLTITDEFAAHVHHTDSVQYRNCHYWPHFSVRPGMTKVNPMLSLGNFNSSNFEWNYAQRWKNAGFKTGFFNQITCQKTPNAILFYVGPAFVEWNYTFGETNALGGSEQAVRYLSRHFPEYIVYVCGDVIEETVGNVNYVKQAPSIHYKAVIVSRNLSFFDDYPTHSADRVILMAHDNALYGVPDVQATLDKWKHVIKTCVCSTKYHADVFSSLYPTLPLSIINNGIEPSLFLESDKIPHRFLFTSRSERGLETLLDLWPSILEKFPDASLRISSYEAKDEQLNPKMDTIQHLGKLSPSELYSEMAVSEYWLFPSDYLETSCITAMEMMASKVKCFYYPIGGLVDTMGTYGIPMIPGKELESLDSVYDIDRARDYALSCSWKNKADEWKKLIEPTILNLIIYTNNVHEIEMKKVQESYIYNYPFVTSYFLSFRDQEQSAMIENTTIYVKGSEDGLYTIIDKTIEALKLPLVYDYVYRTNISTITDFNELLPQLCEYGGDKNNIYIVQRPGKDNNNYLFNFKYVQGTCIVMNKRCVQLLLDYRGNLNDYEDDVVISHVLSKSGITPTYLESFIFRNKSIDRQADVDVMKKCVHLL